MKFNEIVLALTDRYRGEEWAFFREVSNGTGSHSRRRADAIAMNLYPSRGLEIHGFEIKVSRSDLIKELKNPQKCEEVARHCDRWWLVLGDEKLIKEGELPPTWGLMTPKGSKIHVKRPAPLLENVVPLDRVFVASLLRAASKSNLDDTIIAEAVRQALEQEEKNIENRLTRKLNIRSQGIERVWGEVEDFQKSSGINIKKLSYAGGKIGPAVNFVLDGKLEQAQVRFDYLLRSVSNLKNDLESIQQELQAIAQGEG